MVGLASRRILLHPTTDHMVAQVFRLQQPHGGETSIRVRRTRRAVLELQIRSLLRHKERQAATKRAADTASNNAAVKNVPQTSERREQEMNPNR